MSSSNLLTVVIPVRAGATPEITLRSLNQQTFRDFSLVISPDAETRGANWARNRGFALVKTRLVLFSDDDIRWQPDGLEILVRCLEKHPEASYVYGWYSIGDRTFCQRDFDARELRKQNYISTMSVIQVADFPGFDESIQRLQDWDLWLTILERGKVGVYCGAKVFSTQWRGRGITEGSLPWDVAEKIVREKHGL